ncbi:MAG: mechanosensitive ion channel family protein [Oscillospiraceae bacterium]|nr:mechanosensitive ion channel family protein [Oscillospiraceae bacterium]
MQAIIDFFKNESDNTLVEFLKTALVTLIVMVLVVNIINLIFKSVEKSAARRGAHPTAAKILKYILLGLVYIAAFAEIISAIPALGNFLKTLLAGSGIAAVIITVAAQEPIGNLVSGLLIFASKPFKAGDIIRYVEKDISGVVEEINLRHTVIRTFENKRFIVPNNTFNKYPIENANYNGDKICMLLDFAITYESDAVLAMQIISDVVVMHPDFCDNRTYADITNGMPPVRTAVVKFSESAVIIRAWIWAANMGASISLKSDVLLGVQLRFAEAGIRIAYPHTTVIIDKEK